MSAAPHETTPPAEALPLTPTSKGDHSSTSLMDIDSRTQFQKIEGFGGAFTEAAALVFAHLSDADQQRSVAADLCAE